jgi:mono/diheme cytochrome c family protein
MTWMLRALCPPGAAVLAAFRVATVLITLPCNAAFARASEQTPRSGSEIYRQACAACHGTDGRGQPVERVGFETPLPDFSDCGFATPEPDNDWIAIVHHGGPARAFDRRMPAFTDALSDAEIASVVLHLRSFCRDASWPRGELNLPRAIFTEKAFPENEALVTVEANLEGPGAIDHAFVYEKRVGARNQFELTLPISAAHIDGSWHGGLGDVSIAAKRVIAHSIERGSILSLGGELAMPTGDDRIASRTTRVEPFVSFGQLLHAEAFFQAHAGFELSTDRTRAEHEAFWRVALGKSFARDRLARTWSPMIELLAARELESGQRIEWDAVPQLQVTLSKRQHIMVSGGVQLPLTGRRQRDTRFVFYLLWDWFDGGLTTGW